MTIKWLTPDEYEALEKTHNVLMCSISTARNGKRKCKIWMLS